jgi:hypothetical protein
MATATSEEESRLRAAAEAAREAAFPQLRTATPSQRQQQPAAAPAAAAASRRSPALNIAPRKQPAAPPPLQPAISPDSDDAADASMSAATVGPAAVAGAEASGEDQDASLSALGALSARSSMFDYLQALGLSQADRVPSLAAGP